MSQSHGSDLAAMGRELGGIVDRTVKAADEERLSPEAAAAVARATNAFAVLVQAETATAPRLAELAAPTPPPTFGRGTREYGEALTAEIERMRTSGEHVG